MSSCADAASDTLMDTCTALLAPAKAMPAVEPMSA